MKIRIKDNSIRLRLTQGEVNELEKTTKVSATTSFLNESTLTYSLIWSKEENYSAIMNDHEIEVRVPQSAGQKWLDPTQVGMEQLLELKNGDHLRILVEKDFACLTERVDEDESDNFPNPLSTC